MEKKTLTLSDKAFKVLENVIQITTHTLCKNCTLLALSEQAILRS